MIQVKRSIVWCALALGAAACSGSGDGGDDDVAACETPAWVEAVHDDSHSILSVWGRASDDVYMVGGSLDAGGQMSALLHWDGSKITELDPGTNMTLWWIWGTDDGSTLWMVGEGGTVIRRVNGQVEQLQAPTTSTLFGVWGSGPDDVWIVGGTPGPDGADKDMVLHWDGAQLTRDPLPVARGTALLKIWGSGPNDIWVVGEGGTLWHRGADGWTDRSGGLHTEATINSVYGCNDHEVYAVGGSEIFRFDGTGWFAVDGAKNILFGSTVGVSCGEQGVVIVGLAGLKLRYDRASHVWSDETLEAAYDADFHATWISPAGEIWAVGGNYTAPPTTIERRTGLVAYRGCATPAKE